MDIDAVTPNLFIGDCPTRPDDIEYLKRVLEVTAVVNLQTDDDFATENISWQALQEHYQSAGIELRRIPIRDGSPGTLEILLPDVVAVLDQLFRAEHRVFVHCNAGVNRSPSAAIAYLCWIGQMDLDQAVALVKEKRCCDPYVENIRQAEATWKKLRQNA